MVDMTLRGGFSCKHVEKEDDGSCVGLLQPFLDILNRFNVWAQGLLVWGHTKACSKPGSSRSMFEQLVYAHMGNDPIGRHHRDCSKHVCNVRRGSLETSKRIS